MTSPSESSPAPSPLGWKEVRDHLIESLQLDPKWITEGPEQLRWQLGYLPTTIFFNSRGEYARDDSESRSRLTWIRITAFTILLTVDEEQGAALAEQRNAHFSFGSFFWDQGALMVATSLQLNANSRGILTLLHTAILAQAAAAHEASRMLFARAENDEGRQFVADSLLTSDDQLGMRDELDDLLSFYANEGPRAADDSLAVSGAACIARWEAANSYVTELMSQKGWELVIENEDVIAFSSGEMTVGIVPVATGDLANMYGPGLGVQYSVSPRLEKEPGSVFLNNGNRLIATQGPSHLGNLGLVLVDDILTAAVFAYLPLGYLYGFQKSEEFAIAVINTVIYVTSGATHALIE